MCITHIYQFEKNAKQQKNDTNNFYFSTDNMH